MKNLLLSLAFLSLVHASTQASVLKGISPEETVFENLGSPVRLYDLNIQFTTRLQNDTFIAWGVNLQADSLRLIGIHIPSGKVTEVDLSHFGLRRPQMFRGPYPQDGSAQRIYAFTGVPGRFVEFNPDNGQLTDLGVPSTQVSYWLRGTTAPDGKFYLGTFPQTELVRCDPTSGAVENLGRVTEDADQRYIIQTAVDEDGIAFCLVGMKRLEVWSINLSTGERRRLLQVPGNRYTGGDYRLWQGQDGKVYGILSRKDSEETLQFRCNELEIEEGVSVSPAARPFDLVHAGDVRVTGMDKAANLMLRDLRSGAPSVIATEYEGRPVNVMSLGGEYEGYVYGGCVSPANSFRIDQASGQLENLGVCSSSKVQIYDTFASEEGMFLSSYTPASIDFYRWSGGETLPVVTLTDQERGKKFTMGSDGKLYLGMVPAKGMLGNAVVQIDPESLQSTVWRDIGASSFPDLQVQSIHALAQVPNTNLLAGSTSIYGGSSSVPQTQNASVFFWDVLKEKVTNVINPFEKADTIDGLAVDKRGLLYGVVPRFGARYFVYDTTTEKLLHTGSMPVTKRLVYPYLTPTPCEQDGLIYGVGDGHLMAIDPRHPEKVSIIGSDPVLKKAHVFFLSKNGTLYIAAGNEVWRARLSDIREKTKNKNLL